MEQTEKTKEVARNFCVLMRKAIGPHMLARVVNLNSAESSPNVCHTHDYCDANMVMEAAMHEAGVETDTETEGDGGDRPWFPVWNAAWDMAKAAGFDEKRI